MNSYVQKLISSDLKKMFYSDLGNTCSSWKIWKIHRKKVNFPEFNNI